MSAALKTNTFGWGKLGQFYLTMVSPYVLTYAGLLVIDLLVPDLLSGFLDAGLIGAAFMAIVRNLLVSVYDNLKKLALR